MRQDIRTKIQCNSPKAALRRNSISAFLATLFLCVAATSIFAATVNLNSPTGTHGLIMVDKVGGFVRFFDPVSDKELASFDPSPDPGIKPHELAISPDHKTAYVSVYGDGVYGKNPHPGHTVAIIDLDSRKMLGSIDVSPYQAPHGIQVDAKGNIYVTCDLSRKVLILDPKTRSIKATIDVEGTGHWITILPDASKLYVANKNDKPFITVIDLKTRKVVGKVPMPNGTQGVVASPDGKTVLAADFSEPIIHVISTATDTEIDKIRVTVYDKGLYKIFYSPDGKRVVTCVTNGQINIFNASDLHAPQHVMKSEETRIMGLAFSADGKTALLGNHDLGTVTRIDLETATVINTFSAGKGVETLAYF